MITTEHILDHHFELYRTVARLCGGKADSLPAFEWVSAPLGNDYPNFIFNENMQFFDNEEGMQLLSSGALPPFWLSQNADLDKFIKRAGFRKIQRWQAMGLYESHLREPRAVEGFRWFRVSSEEQLLEWTELLSEGFHSSYEGGYFVPLLHEGRFEFYLGYIGSTAVATTLNFYWENTVGVHMVSTHKDYRRQGIGQRAFYESLRSAFARGIERAICTAMPKGANAWQQIGFEIYAKLYLYWQVSKANL
jgi:GNAT superfamily N-acetyltransferase